MTEIDQKYQPIKFGFKFSEESIEFLDKLVYIDSNNSRLPSTKKQVTVKAIYMVNWHIRSHLKKYFL